MTGALHQFVAGVEPGDAITDQALIIRGWLRALDFDAHIYAEHIHRDLESEARPISGFRVGRDGPWLIAHHSIGASFLGELAGKGLKVILIYHNITPPEFFEAIDPAQAQAMRAGQAQLRALRPITELALADSAYNEVDLKEIGYLNTGVLPITLAEERYAFPADVTIAARLGPGPILLFVGRISPNKKQEDLVKLLYYLRRIQPTAQLVLVGSPWLGAYERWIRDLAQELGLAEAVTLTGRVSQQEMVGYYRAADLYVSMSEHEGFGKPLIESMYLGVPILAYRCAAVPDTLGDAGVLFKHKDYEALAELADLLIAPGELRQRVIARQHERVQRFLEPQVRSRFEGHLRSLGLI